MKKKVLCFVVLVIAICSILAGCVNTDNDINKAIDVFSDNWKEYFADSKNRGRYEDIDVLKVDIIHTRVIYINENPKIESTSTQKAYEQYLSNIVKIVEFKYLTDYYDCNYPTYPGVDSEVIFYKDGTTEVRSSIMQQFIALSYDPDAINAIIKEIKDLGSKYNRTLNIKLDK